LADKSEVVSDNGIGIPVQFKDKKPGSPGMSSMAGLSEDLDGSFTMENTFFRLICVQSLNVKWDIFDRDPYIWHFKNLLWPFLSCFSYLFS